jgi:hypothetical protein
MRVTKKARERIQVGLEKFVIVKVSRKGVVFRKENERPTYVINPNEKIKTARGMAILVKVDRVNAEFEISDS